jgi:hypothetical protein
MRTRSRKGTLKKERDQPGRMSVDTAWRRHDRAMRQGRFLLPGSASSDSAHSRRNTVMSALPQSNGVIHAYQSDTSSTRSTPSVLTVLLRNIRVRDGPPSRGFHPPLTPVVPYQPGGSAPGAHVPAGPSHLDLGRRHLGHGRRHRARRRRLDLLRDTGAFPSCSSFRPGHPD